MYEAHINEYQDSLFSRSPLETQQVFQHDKLEFKFPAATMLHVAVTFQTKATMNKKYGTFVTDNGKHHQK
jgi:hypothetical protein